MYMHAHNPSPFDVSEKPTVNNVASLLTPCQIAAIGAADVMSWLRYSGQTNLVKLHTLNIHDWDNFST